MIKTLIYLEFLKFIITDILMFSYHISPLSFSGIINIIFSLKICLKDKHIYQEIYLCWKKILNNMIMKKQFQQICFYF